MVEFNFHYDSIWPKRHFNPKKIWIDSEVRIRIIKDGIDRAGSINRLARLLGYRARIHPGWNVRQILLGYQPFTLIRLQTLSQLIDMPLEQILRHQVEKQRITLYTTNHYLKEYGLWCYVLR